MEWISCKDELPKLMDGARCSENVFVYINRKPGKWGSGPERSIAYYTVDGWAYQYGDLMSAYDQLNTTHWMPLPEPPKQ